MNMKVIPLSDLRADLETWLRRCLESGDRIAVEMPDHRKIALSPIPADSDENDDLTDRLIAGNAKFRAMLEASATTPRVPLESVFSDAGDMSPEAVAVFDFLISEGARSRRVVTYGEIEKGTGVPIGAAGSNIGRKLSEVVRFCDHRQLPQLAAIAVRGGDEAGLRMPGPGFFTAIAEHGSGDVRGRFPGIERFAGRRPGFDADTERLAYANQVHSMQEEVFNYAGSWPVIMLAN